MTNFDYNRDTPFASNNPSFDQPKMQVNTNSIDDLIDVDHYSFGENNGGTHRQVNLTNEVSPSIAADLVLYSTNAGGLPALWAKNSTNDFPLFTGTPNGATQGTTSMYGGLILKWGFVDGTHGAAPKNFLNNDSGDVFFSVTGSTFPNNCYVVFTHLAYTTTVPSTTDGAIYTNTALLTKDKFHWVFVGGTEQVTRFYWMAIGN